MLRIIGQYIRSWTQSNPWTNVYGVGRTLLALSGAAVLAVNDTHVLFHPALGTPDPPVCTSMSTASLFCMLPDAYVELGRWIAVGILLVVASGWRPRVTGMLHWWVAYSFMSTGVLVTGGEAITALLTLLLVPITLTDPRRWHWSSLGKDAVESTSAYARVVAWGAWLLIRIQVAGVYFHSAVGKVTVEEWANGTALYYWLVDPAYGMPPWAEPLLLPLVTHAVGVTVLTWGVVLFEFFLFAGLVMDRRWRPYLLVLGILFHAGIAVLQGLLSFSVIMFGALIMYLRPLNRPFDLDRVAPYVRSLKARLRLTRRTVRSAVL